ncbi:hypothetical protein [Bacillus sp. Marseille-P3661]|uniref:hypothetical protein n=1 Tax=Bacillus sp. Marseille-P3661 TaxID=1936234 RepID=UPI000C841A83|nr:hypothetical protein [Bacillus sp. Marseille-P3661]
MGSVMGLVMIGIILFYFAVIPMLFAYNLWQTVRFFQRKSVIGGKGILMVSNGFLLGTVCLVLTLF